MRLPDDDERLLLAAKLALAGFFSIVFAMLGIFVVLGPLVDKAYEPDPVLLVPVGTATLGAVLMLMGINSGMWRGGGK